VSVSVLGTRFQTPVCRRTLSPVYTAKDATFDFPIYLSLSDKLGALEFVVWDKDMLRKEYMGEFALSLDGWFKGSAFAFDDPDNQVRRMMLPDQQNNLLSLAFLRQPHILTYDDPCDWYHAHQSWLHPTSQLHDPAQFRGYL
jgi:hypothetical protein